MEHLILLGRLFHGPGVEGIFLATENNYWGDMFSFLVPVKK